jgi:beta-mannosidase
MHKQVIQLFGEVPDNLEDYSFASQISQAEAFKYLIERMRVARPQKSGIIWWNLLDGWPQMSDAVVDYYYTKKLAYHYIKISQAPFTIAADEPKNGNLKLYACNDTLAKKSGTLTVKYALSGKTVHSCAFDAAENASTHIATLETESLEEKMLIFEWSAGEESGRNHYLCAEPPIDLDEYKEFLHIYFYFYME